RAVAFAHLADDDRDLRHDRCDLAGPAGLGVAGVAVVRVPGGDEVAVGVGGLVRQPLAQVVAVLLAAEHQDVAGAGGADGGDHALHAGDGVADAGEGAAGLPALPAGGGAAGGAGGVGLVEEIEDHRVVA